MMMEHKIQLALAAVASTLVGGITINAHIEHNRRHADDGRIAPFTSTIESCDDHPDSMMVVLQTETSECGVCLRCAEEWKRNQGFGESILIWINDSKVLIRTVPPKGDN